ncbi:unnamed protein product [Absidia cylindrospora]
MLTNAYIRRIFSTLFESQNRPLCVLPLSKCSSTNNKKSRTCDNKCSILQKHQAYQLPNMHHKVEEPRKTSRNNRLRHPPTTKASSMCTSLSASLRIGQIQKNSKQLNIDNNRVLDINYPAMNTTLLLEHNDFVTELITRLTKAGIHTIDDFDPTSHQHLRDPKYIDKPNDERTEIATSLHNQRMIHSVDFIRAPVKFAVARSFAKAGWITQELLSIPIGRTYH